MEDVGPGETLSARPAKMSLKKLMRTPVVLCVVDGSENESYADRAWEAGCTSLKVPSVFPSAVLSGRRSMSSSSRVARM